MVLAFSNVLGTIRTCMDCGRMGSTCTLRLLLSLYEGMGIYNIVVVDIR